MNQPLGVAIIGCGYAARDSHVPALDSLSEAKLVGLVDLDEQALQALSQHRRLSVVSKDIRDLVTSSEVEAVAICTPPHTHRRIAEQLVHAGKHVLIEKPLAHNQPDSQALVDLYQTSSVKMMVGYNLRFLPAVQRAKSWIQAGRLGEIQVVQSTICNNNQLCRGRSCYKNERSLGGGALLECAVHHFDLWRYLLNSEVESIACAQQSDQRGQDLSIALSGQLTNGTLAGAVSSRASTGQNRIEVYGTEAALSLAFYRFDGLFYWSGQGGPGRLSDRFWQMREFVSQLPYAISCWSTGGTYQQSFRRQWQHFLTCIREDSAVSCTPFDGLRASEISWLASTSKLVNESSHDKHYQ